MAFFEITSGVQRVTRCDSFFFGAQRFADFAEEVFATERFHRLLGQLFGVLFVRIGAGLELALLLERFSGQ